jgi:3-methyladenine DNA glycosylase/8-oxoguanine DNA glycosylase
MATRSIPLPFEVHLGWSLAGLRLGRHDPTIQLGDRTVVRASRTPQGPVTVRADHQGDRIEVEAWGPGADWALEQAPGLVGTLDERHGFDPVHPLIQRLHREGDGLRMIRTDRVVEALLPAVLGQRVTGFEAKRSYHQLIERWGEPAPGPGGLLLHPPAERIAVIPYYELHLIGMERRRADALKRLAAHASRLEDAGSGTSAALRERLESVPGVGPWTSAEVARLALGDPDSVSVGDYHLKHLVSWALAGEPRGTDARMLELLEPYAGHRGRVCQLLEVAGPKAPRRGPRRRIEPLAAR